MCIEGPPFAVDLLSRDTNGQDFSWTLLLFRYLYPPSFRGSFLSTPGRSTASWCLPLSRGFCGGTQWTGLSFFARAGGRVRDRPSPSVVVSPPTFPVIIPGFPPSEELSPLPLLFFCLGGGVGRFLWSDGVPWNVGLSISVRSFSLTFFSFPLLLIFGNSSSGFFPW